MDKMTSFLYILYIIAGSISWYNLELQDCIKGSSLETYEIKDNGAMIRRSERATDISTEDTMIPLKCHFVHMTFYTYKKV